MSQNFYGENGVSVESLELDGYEEIDALVGEIGYELPFEQGERSLDGAEAEFDLAHPHDERFASALIYNDEVTAWVELEIQTRQEKLVYRGKVTENAYDIFSPSDTGLEGKTPGENGQKEFQPTD